VEEGSVQPPKAQEKQHQIFHQAALKHTIIPNSLPGYKVFPKLAEYEYYSKSFLTLVLFQEKNKKDSLFHDDNLIASILDLVMAGTETTATTLQWAILLMMKYPEIQSELLVF